MKFIKKPQYLKVKTSEKISVLGNGPSLKLVPPNHKFEGIIFGMNRVDRFLEKHNLTLDYYIFVTDNIENPIWGNDWFSSLKNSSEKSKNVIISKAVFDLLKNKHPDFQENFTVLECLKEPKVYSKNSVVYPKDYFTKTGTSINLVLQVALLMNPNEIHLYGADCKIAS